MSLLLRNTRLLFLVTLVLLAPLLKAQGIEDKLPAKFVRITSMEDITDSGYYLIGSIGMNKHYAYFLSSVQTNNNKLKGVYYGEYFNDIIDNDNIKLIWKLVRSENGQFEIVETESGKKIYAGNKDKEVPNGTDLGISSITSSKWNLNETDKGTFLATSVKDNSRYISISETDKNSTVFGNYKETYADNINLYIFKLVTDFNQLPGNNVKPADGECLTVTTGELLPTIKFTGQGFEDFQLHNGVIASDDELASFTVTTCADNMFTLKSDNGLFLQYDLKMSETETKWQIYNGHIATIHKTPKYLLYNNAENRFAIFTFSEATDNISNISFVEFKPIGEKPNFTKEAGILTLSGAWSKNRLSNISFEDVSAIDLSDISLPIHCDVFKNYPQSANIPIYVSEEDAAFVPETWNFTVAGNQLLRETILNDRTPLNIPKEIVFEDNQILYKRSLLDGDGWETICLPFEADLPKDFIFEKLYKIDNNDLIFNEVNTIISNIPLILAKRSKEQTGELTIKSKAGSMKNYEASINDYFIGTYKRLTVGKDDTNLYFLHNNGQTFTLAAEGSGLSPFRAYIRLNKASSSPLYINHRTTSISSPQIGRNDKAYYIDGREVDIRNVGKGLYIINGKKIINTKP